MRNPRAFAVAAVLVLSLRAARLGAAEIRCPARAGGEVAPVAAVARGIIDADNRRAIDEVMAFYSESAVLWPPNGRPVQGAEIRRRYEALFAGYTPQLVAEIDAVCVGTRLAVVHGRNGGRMAPRGRSPERAVDDAYLMVLAPEDGRWKISQLAWAPRTGTPAAPVTASGASKDPAQLCADADSGGGEDARAAGVLRDLIAADNARSIDRTLAAYDPEAVWWPPGEPPMAGLQEIRSRYEKLFESEPKLTIEISGVCRSDDLAIVQGRTSGRIVAVRGGGDRVADGPFFAVLHREAGRWRITDLVWR
jgi:ketosteroid isomerase-like protein